MSELIEESTNNVKIIKDVIIDNKTISNDNNNNNNDINNKNIKLISLNNGKQIIIQDLLKKMLSFFNINFIDIKELINVEIERSRFLTPEIVDHFQKFKLDFKNLGYNTGKLTSLHQNNLIKQKFPAINMLRQLLKCNSLLLKPKIKSNGYDKVTGKKNIIRYFIIVEKNASIWFL